MEKQQKNMKRLLRRILTVLGLLAAGFPARPQSLVIDSTLFIGCDSLDYGSTACYFSLPTNDGGLLFIGYTKCSNSGNIPYDSGSVTGSLVAKLDSNLHFVWVRQFGCGGNTIGLGCGAVQTPDGGYAILGNTNSDDTLIPGDHGGGDLWLFKIDAAGNFLWQRCFGGPFFEQPGSIAITPDGGFILLGTSTGAGGDVPFHFGDNFSLDWFVVKTDSLGNKQWSNDYGGTGDESTGTVLSADGGYFIVGSSYSRDYDCQDTFWHPGINTETDAYIFRLDTTGAVLWDSSYGGSGVDCALQAIWDERDSSIVMVGMSASNDYMVTGNYGVGGDMWVTKTNRDGTLLWSQCRGNNYGETFGTSICSAPYGYLAYGWNCPGTIGQQNLCVYAFDLNGDSAGYKIFGGSGWTFDFSASAIPLRNGYAVSGMTPSNGFTEGSNLGTLPASGYDCAFLAYVDYFPVGVANVVFENKDLTLFPNPAHDYIRMHLPAKGNFAIYALDGTEFYSNVADDYIEICTSGFPPGIYIVKFIYGEFNVIYSKFSKN